MIHWENRNDNTPHWLRAKVVRCNRRRGAAKRSVAATLGYGFPIFEKAVFELFSGRRYDGPRFRCKPPCRRQLNVPAGEIGELF
jgi:hypothetical protein